MHPDSISHISDNWVTGRLSYWLDKLESTFPAVGTAFRKERRTCSWEASSLISCLFCPPWTQLDKMAGFEVRRWYWCSLYRRYAHCCCINSEGSWYEVGTKTGGFKLQVNLLGYSIQLASLTWVTFNCLQKWSSCEYMWSGGEVVYEMWTVEPRKSLPKEAILLTPRMSM